MRKKQVPFNLYVQQLLHLSPEEGLSSIEWWYDDDVGELSCHLMYVVGVQWPPRWTQVQDKYTGLNKIVKDNRIKMWAKVGFELHNSYNNDRHHNMNGGSLWAANCWLIRVQWYYYACHCGSMYYVGFNFWRRSAGIIFDLKEMLRRIWLGLSFNSQVTRWHKLLPLLSNCHPHRWPLLIPVGLKMVRSWLWHIFEKCVHTRVIMWRL